MNPIDLILQDHSLIRELFASLSKDLNNLSKKNNPEYIKLRNLLIQHERMEQQLWYPDIKDNKEISSIIEHLISEEKGAEKIIKELHSITNGDEFTKKFKELRNEVEHHASEEETKLFPKVQAIIAPEKLAVIANKLFDFKKEAASLIEET